MPARETIGHATTGQSPWYAYAVLRMDGPSEEGRFGALLTPLVDGISGDSDDQKSLGSSGRTLILGSNRSACKGRSSARLKAPARRSPPRHLCLFTTTSPTCLRNGASKRFSRLPMIGSSRASCHVGSCLSGQIR